MRHTAARVLCLAAGLVLVGCSAGPVMEQVLPQSLGGLPAGAPARPATPYQYPAVHDMPPPRENRPMTEDELLKAEKDLQAIRDRQEAREGQGSKAAAAAKKPAGTVAKKRATGGNDSQSTGAKTNP